MIQQPVHVIDSHTGGEPTRIVFEGGPNLDIGPVSKQRDQFRDEFDHFRRSIIHEPRGNDFLVGGLLCEPEAPDCCAGVIFFNNVGFLGMCGHGTIGLIETLAHLGRIKVGVHRIETPAGVVTAKLHADRRVTIENVPSFRYLSGVSVETPAHGKIHGDVAWGGNWFFLAHEIGESLTLDNVESLRRLALEVRNALRNQGVTGRDDAYIDHIEFSGPPVHPEADSRNFVLCPGGEYDRSPCGTGTSAKVACLVEANVLQPGETYCQESITGSTFIATTVRDGNQIIPSITSRAHVYAESRLLFDPDDPLTSGVGGS